MSPKHGRRLLLTLLGPLALVLSLLVLPTPATAAPARAPGSVSSVASTSAPAPTQAQARKKKKPKAKPKPKPQWQWTPRTGSMFNHPFGTDTERYRIRRYIRALVRNSPPGSKIRLTAFAFRDPGLAQALVNARKRGVSVQLLVNAKSAEESAPLQRMFKALGRSLHGHPRKSLTDASWARVCKASCRGIRGNVHSKIYLFSQVGKAHDVAVLSSANLTTFAAEGQWNHLNTFINKRLYRKFLAIFNQMKHDRPVRHPFTTFTVGKVGAWIFPHYGTNPRTDPMMRVLDTVNCKARKGTGLHGHTVIRIGMYAWFDSRGNWLARKVRHLWNQGCNVRIFYSVMNGQSKRILYSPTGRGRIPMRRSITTLEWDYTLNEEVIREYNHSKYVAINGTVNKRGRRMVLAGSTNFSNLGLNSDDLTLVMKGAATYGAYVRDFAKTWREPTSKKPYPTRAYGRYAPEPEPVLGKGPLANLEED